MAEDFGIPQLVDYLTRMGLRLGNVDQEKEIIELAFHGNHGQWRLIVGLQQSAEIRKLMLIVPHFGTLESKRRGVTLEALMAVNYRIAIGKFGLDLEDGEIRLEEAIPLADGSITFEQFQLALGAIMQVVAMYHSLLPRIRYANLTAQEALEECEREFFEESHAESSEQETGNSDEDDDDETPELPPELDVDDVMAEITRLFEEGREKE